MLYNQNYPTLLNEIMHKRVRKKQRFGFWETVRTFKDLHLVKNQASCTIKNRWKSVSHKEVQNKPIDIFP